MEMLTLKKTSEKYQSNIDVFNNMILYKRSLTHGLASIMTQVETQKLQLGRRNDTLIQKMIILVYDYQNDIDKSDWTLFALTKAAVVILSELDMPTFATLEGHHSFYNSYENYCELTDAEREKERLSIFLD